MPAPSRSHHWCPSSGGTAPRLRRTGEEQNDAGLEPAHDLGNAVIPDGIAGDVDLPHRGIIARQYESDHVACQRFDAGGAMSRGSGRNPNRFAVLTQIDGLPRRQPLAISSEALCSHHCRENARGLSQKIATGIVEIVGVLIVAEQHGIERAELRGRNRGPPCFRQRDMWQLVVAGFVEGWIGEETETAELDERGRATNQSNTRRHRSSPVLSCLPAE